MKAIDIVILVLVGVAVAAITAWTVWRKKTKKGCGCDCHSCQNCPTASHCQTAKERENDA